MSMVPCPHRGDHKISPGRMHGPGQCPPPPGERGDHRRMKRIAARRRAEAAEFNVGIVRGVEVAGVGGSKAKTHRRGKKKAGSVA